MQTPDIEIEAPQGKTVVGFVAAPLAVFGAFKLGKALVGKIRNRREVPQTPLTSVED